ncbi:MAG: exonuclease domain-containing protein [Legionellaceae bacterium]|nr:exonuclease domain-containing protein [Legionellaceae bacterium]
MAKSKKPTVPNKKNKKAPGMSELAVEEKGQGCSENVFASLVGSDEHGRHYKNSRLIGHALITEDASNAFDAKQYAVKQSSETKTAIVRKLTNIQRIAGHRNAWFRAKDEEGNKYISRRHLGFETKGEPKAELRYFSEHEYDSSDLSEFSDDEAPVEILRDDLTPQERDKISEIPLVVKSKTLELISKDVLLRDQNPERDGDQNQVMGQSAKNAYEDVLSKMIDYLSPNLILILKRAIDARLFISPENEFRPEWLHKIAHSLSLISDKAEDNPQQANNLGAAGKWANTEMMILERIAKWFSLSEENAKVTMTCLFEMLLGSEVIRGIHFEVMIEMKEQWIRLIQNIDVFKEYPTFRKTSDLAQTTAIIDAIFSGMAPVSIEKVSVIEKADKSQASSLASSASSEVSVVLEGPCEKEPEDVTQALKILNLSPEYKVCRHIQSDFPKITPKEPFYIITILDTETTDLDASKGQLIEIAMRAVAVSKATNQILGVVDTYQGLEEPKDPLSSEIIRITKLTNEQLQGKRIDWERVLEIFLNTKYVICHNAKFDRAFLEQQTPEIIQNRVKKMQFACTLEDINWYRLGYDPRKLDYLNFLLGYFYKAHRALIDCDAVLNLLLNVPGIFDELRYNAHRKHMFFFSNPLLGNQECLPSVSVDETSVDGKMPSQSAIDTAYALLSGLPQYEIYRSVPKPLPTGDSVLPTHPIMAIIDLKTTGNDFLTDSITAVSVLSFSMIDGVPTVIDLFADSLTEDHPINWERVAEILYRTQYLLGHKQSINRKFLESSTPAEVQCRVRALPCASMDLAIDWKQRNISNTSLKYIAFMFGYYFDSNCLMEHNYATLNLLQVVQGASTELLSSLQKKQTIILLTGPFCFEIRDELKRKGFKWSTGSGKMGKGWWACIDKTDTPEMMRWLLDTKDRAPGKNAIYCRTITPLERYSIRAEFKAVEMSVVERKEPTAKRELADDAEELLERKVKPRY